MRRISPDSLIPHAKASGQYLNSILAKTETANAGYDEAILLDQRGMVCEGSGENIFVDPRRPDRHARPHNSSILDGITRKSVIQIARDLGYTVVERDVARAELYLAEEVFLTGTAAELVPVREIDHQELGEPGEITRVIQAKFEDALHGRAEEYLEWLDPVGEADAGGRRPGANYGGRDRLGGSRRTAAAVCTAPFRGPYPRTRTQEGLMRQVLLYDTTLRDGMQGQGMSLSAQEKVRVVRKLDELGHPPDRGRLPGLQPEGAGAVRDARRGRARAGGRLRVRHDPAPRHRGRRGRGAGAAGVGLRARSSPWSARPGSSTWRR